MTASTPYPSPNEERAKRRGGRGFYADRGRSEKPRPGHTTEHRDRRRSSQDLEVVELSRELARLAEKFPRFRESAFQWRHQVLLQARSLNWKCRVVGQCLVEVSSVEDVTEETGLDSESVKQTLEVLERRGQAMKCTREGERVVFRRDGRPTEKVYWRRGDNRKSI